MKSAFGVLAKKFCQMRLPVTVLQSAKGFYLGTVDPESGPVSRESLEYFPTQGAADHAQSTGSWTQRDHP